MPSFKVAHLREQGQDMIIVPLSSNFANMSSNDQRSMLADLQGHARSAGLAGKVVAVWSDGGRMGFIAPPPWHPFFRGLSMPMVMRNVNKELSW